MKTNQETLETAKLFKLIEFAKTFIAHNPTQRDSVIASLQKWFDFLENLEPEKYIWLVELGVYLPDPYNFMLEKDPGYTVACSIIANHNVFYICEDCSTPLTYDFRGDGCYFCGDTFPSESRERRRIDLTSVGVKNNV